jgi:hypothetical protein
MFSGSSAPTPKPTDTISQVEFSVAGFKTLTNRNSHITFLTLSSFLIPCVGEVQQGIPTDQ